MSAAASKPRVKKPPQHTKPSKPESGAAKETVEQPVLDAKPTEQTSTIPPSVAVAVERIIALIPEDARKDADQVLHDAIQHQITRIKQMLEADNAREMSETLEILRTRAKEALQAKMTELEKAAGPLNPDDMQKLVSQEYLKFPLKIISVDDDGHDTEETFTIREVPQATEKKLLALITEKLAPMVKQIQSIKFTTGQSNMENIQQALKSLPGAVDMIAAATAICLNPYGKREEITAEWVSNNVGSARQMAILECQFMASRMRDFFYAVSRVSQGM